MKKLFLIVGLLIAAQVSFSQIFSWGIKAGVNSTKISFDDFSIDAPPTVGIDYNYLANNPEAVTTDGDGNITYIDPQVFTVTAPKVKFTPSSYNMGYHFGAFARIKVLGVFIQPELIFSQTKTEINFEGQDATSLIGDIKNSSAEIKYSNFDVPVMCGVKLGPARIYAGPVATFKLGNKVGTTPGDEIGEMIDDYNKVAEKATFGGQAGVGLDILSKVTLDVRYEFPLSKLGDNVTIGGNSYSTDQRASQFIASIGWMF